jgi:hypothetical protein
VGGACFGTLEYILLMESHRRSLSRRAVAYTMTAFVTCLGVTLSVLALLNREAYDHDLGVSSTGLGGKLLAGAVGMNRVSLY